MSMHFFKNKKIICCLIFGMLVASTTYTCKASVELPSIFGSGMVLQRDQPIHIWGWANPGERVSVQFKGQRASTRADDAGDWRVRLTAEPAGGPFALSVIGENEIELDNILLGDVWLCSGQSNMEWPLKMTTGANQELSSYANDQIRLFRIGRTGFMQPANDLPDIEWQKANAYNLPDFSAVGHYFAKKIQQTQGIPIGMIQAAWGGTMVEGWMRPQLLEGYPEIEAKQEYLEQWGSIPVRTEKLKEWHKQIDQIDKGMDSGKAVWASPQLDDAAWQSMRLPAYWEEQQGLELDGAVWFRKQVQIGKEDLDDAIIHLGKVDDVVDIFINGYPVDKPYTSKWSERVFEFDSSLLRAGDNLITLRVLDYDHRGGIGGEEDDFYLKLNDLVIGLYGEWKYKVGADASTLASMRANLDEKHLPSIMYNGMIAPLTDFPIKGVLWYQGESNTQQPDSYAKLLQSMIKDWRMQWDNPALPFLIVQLTSFEEPEFFYPFGDWAVIREAQRQTAELTDVEMAVTIDLSDPYNPNNIHPRDKKTVGERLALLARKKVYGEDILAEGPVLSSWEVSKDTVVLTFTNVGEGLGSRGEYGYLLGFEIQGPDQVFRKAQAVIHKDKILVSQPMVDQPKALRYAWSDYPADANLANSSGLPASPFQIRIP